MSSSSGGEFQVQQVRSFDAQPTDQAAARLAACCAATTWVRQMLDGRPYGDRAALLAAADRALAGLSWAQVREALAAHPRIGERAAGAGRENTWSRDEQSGTAQSTPDVRAALAQANRAYEEHFGHVFLVCATGLSDVEMLAAARQRLHNDDADERKVVREELRRIVELRVGKMLDEFG